MNWENKKEILKSFSKEKYKVGTEEFFKDAPVSLLSDESFIKCAVKLKGDILNLCPQNLRNNKDIVLDAINNDLWSVIYASDELKKDRDVVLKSVKSRSDLYDKHLSFPEDLINDIDFLKQIVLINAYNLKFIPEKYAHQEILYLLAIKNNSTIIEFIYKDRCDIPSYVIQDFKKNLNDYAFCLNAVFENSHTYDLLEESTKKDKSFISQIIVKLDKTDNSTFDRRHLCTKLTESILLFPAENTDLILQIFGVIYNDCYLLQNIFKLLPKDLQLDKKFIIKSISYNYEIFEYIDEAFKDDPEVVLHAINLHTIIEKNKRTYNTVKKYSPLKFASDNIKKNYQIVFEAVKRDGYSINFASIELKHDIDILLEAVKTGGGLSSFIKLPLNLQTRDNLLIAVKNGFSSIHDLPSEFITDKQVVFEIVKNYGDALFNVISDFKDNFEIVLAAVNNRGSALKFASDNLKNNKEVVIAAVKNNGLALEFASDELKNDLQIVKLAIENAPKSIQFASNDLKNMKELALIAVLLNKDTFEYISDTLRSDKEIVLIVLNQVAGSFVFKDFWKLLSSKTKNDLDVFVLSLR
jgi:hypothetical protein